MLRKAKARPLPSVLASVYCLVLCLAPINPARLAAARYKATSDHTVLGKVAEELRSTYSTSVWASKAIPWLH